MRIEKLFLIFLVIFALFSSITYADNWFGLATLPEGQAPNGTLIECFDFSNDNSLGTASYFNSNPPFYAVPSYWMVVDPNFNGDVYFKVGGHPVDQPPQKVGEFNGISCSICSDTTHWLNLTVTDADGDGYAKGFDEYKGADKDCDDNNSDINPGVDEILANGIDDDCNPNTYDNFKGHVEDIGGNIDDLSVTIDDSTDLSQFFTGEHVVKFYDNGTLLFEFPFNFTGNYIDFTKLTIIKNENSGAGSLIISGLDLGDYRKTVYVDNLNGKTSLCVKDMDIASVTQITKLCNGANEFVLNCPGTTGNYSCTFTDATNSTFKITGLRYSGVQQQSYCGDGVCDSGEDSSSCPIDCPTTTTTVRTGGGRGYTTCTADWSCTDWSECSPAGMQTRTCTDLNNCGTTAGKPEETRNCTYTGTYCGDGICQADESCDLCPEDCGTCPTTPPVCGNGVCEAGENTDICCMDCGCAAGFNCVDNACVAVTTTTIRTGITGMVTGFVTKLGKGTTAGLILIIAGLALWKKKLIFGKKRPKRKYSFPKKTKKKPKKFRRK